MVANVTQVIASLNDRNLLKKIGGMKRVLDIVLLAEFENSSDLDMYIKELNNKYLRRIII